MFCLKERKWSSIYRFTHQVPCIPEAEQATARHSDLRHAPSWVASVQGHGPSSAFPWCPSRELDRKQRRDLSWAQCETATFSQPAAAAGPVSVSSPGHPGDTPRPVEQSQQEAQRRRRNATPGARPASPPGWAMQCTRAGQGHGWRVCPPTGTKLEASTCSGPASLSTSVGCPRPAEGPSTFPGAAAQGCIVEFLMDLQGVSSAWLHLHVTSVGHESLVWMPEGRAGEAMQGSP